MILFRYSDSESVRYKERSATENPAVILMCERFHKKIVDEKYIGMGWVAHTNRSLDWYNENGMHEISYTDYGGSHSKYTNIKGVVKKIEFNRNGTLNYQLFEDGTEKWWKNGVLSKYEDRRWFKTYYPSGALKSSLNYKIEQTINYHENGEISSVISMKRATNHWPRWIDELQGPEELNSVIAETMNKDFHSKKYDFVDGKCIRVTVDYWDFLKIYENGEVAMGDILEGQKFDKWEIYDLEGNLKRVKIYDTIVTGGETHKYFWKFGELKKIEIRNSDGVLYKVKNYFDGFLSNEEILMNGKWKTVSHFKDKTIYKRRCDGYLYKYWINGTVHSVIKEHLH